MALPRVGRWLRTFVDQKKTLLSSPILKKLISKIELDYWVSLSTQKFF